MSFFPGQLDQYLKDAVSELQFGRFKEAFNVIRKAASAEKDTSALAKQIKGLDQKLYKLVNLGKYKSLNT